MKYDNLNMDLAFRGGKIITVDADHSKAEAVGVKGDKIVFIGTDEELDSILDPRTKIVDLKGRTMTPGFIEGHYHPILSGFMGGAIIDIYYPRFHNVPELLARIREEAAKLQPGRWIKLWGFNQMIYEDHRYPTLEEMDKAAPDNPVQCMHMDGHQGMHNTLALKAGDILSPEDAKRFPEGSVEVAEGKLTGRLFDLALHHVLSRVEYTDEEIADAIARSNQACIQAGLTSVHDCGSLDKRGYSAMYRACHDGSFKPRVYMMLHSIFGKPYTALDNERYIENGFHTGLGDNRFRIGSNKFMIDGGSSGPSCATRQPYTSDPGSCGVLAWTREETRDFIQYVNNNDNQCTAHAVGDLAVEFMVEGYEHALSVHPRKPEEHRHRIEHCGIVDQDLIDRMAKMGIIPCVNSHFFPFNGHSYIRNFGERVEWLYALRSMIDAGLRPCLACDAPSAPTSILMGLDGAVNRKDRKTGEVVGASQRVSLEEAIRCYTINAAYASFEDDIKGSIELGKLADFTVFDRDILSMDPEQIREARVDMTVIGGEIVYCTHPLTSV